MFKRCFEVDDFSFRLIIWIMIYPCIQDAIVSTGMTLHLYSLSNSKKICRALHFPPVFLPQEFVAASQAINTQLTINLTPRKVNMSAERDHFKKEKYSIPTTFFRGAGGGVSGSNPRMNVNPSNVMRTFLSKNWRTSRS